MTKFSGPLRPRPPETTISASLSSGRPWRLPACARPLQPRPISTRAYTRRRASRASPGRNVGRSVASTESRPSLRQRLPLERRVATSFAAIAVRTVESGSPPQRAETEGHEITCRAVTGAKMACGASCRPSAPRVRIPAYGASAFSSSNALGPHSRCFTSAWLCPPPPRPEPPATPRVRPPRIGHDLLEGPCDRFTRHSSAWHVCPSCVLRTSVYLSLKLRGASWPPITQSATSVQTRRVIARARRLFGGGGGLKWLCGRRARGRLSADKLRAGGSRERDRPP